MTITFEKIGKNAKGWSLFGLARLSAFAVFTPLLLTAFPAWAVPPAGYNLVWSDEFNGPVGSAPNSANWTYNTGDGGWGNNELENYTTSTNNSRIVADPNADDGSALAIIAIDTQPGSSNYGAVGRYTSARLVSNAAGFQGVTFQYGYMEARIQMPYGDGIWPAFWMLGTNINTGTVWPNCGETDIMENIGNAADQGNNHGSLHAPNWNPTNIFTLPGGALYHNAYHTFGVLWQPNQIDFYVDGTDYETLTSAQAAASGGTWEFNNPMFFLLNMAVGGNYPGSPDASTSFPQTMLVDYVRVYQPSAGTPTLTPTPMVQSTWRVVAGGAQYTDSRGNVWSADENYSGGTAAVTNSAVLDALPGAGDQALYQSQRYGNPFSYVFNVPAGSYQVTLKFAETYWTAAGDRVFNVSINGNTVLTNFDIFKTAGGSDIAVDEAFNNIAPSGGAITIQFGPASVDNAMVDAIQIIPQPSTPTPTPSATASQTPIPTNTKTGTPTVTSSPTLSKTTTPTATASPTATLTPTNTQTPSPSATASQSPTITYTPTGAPSSTKTPSATPSATASQTSASTNTPTGTPSPTSTSSVQATATQTSTQTPFPSGTSTSTVTVTPTRTMSPTTTVTNTPTVTRTESPSIANTSTLTVTKSPTGTETFTPTATDSITPSATASQTPILTNTKTGTATPSPTRTLTAVATPTSTATAEASVGIPVPFPNPWTGSGPVQVQVILKQPAAWLTIKVYSVAFRMVNEESYQNLPAGPNNFPLAQTGKGGGELANGLYYLEATTLQGHSIGKWLILR